MFLVERVLSWFVACVMLRAVTAPVLAEAVARVVSGLDLRSETDRIADTVVVLVEANMALTGVPLPDGERDLIHRSASAGAAQAVHDLLHEWIPGASLGCPGDCRPPCPECEA